VRELVLLDTAIDDFVSILQHIARESGNRAVARQFVDRLWDQCARLAALRGTLGRPRPELGTDLRSFAFKGYVIFFRYTADSFEVIKVAEGHQDIDAYFHRNPSE
jgi:plasmid stabilization system protein ParE